MRSLNFFFIILLILVASFFSKCENKERFYRPNLPEELCSIGIIDADDTTRYISFEKSFQAEYLDEINDSLRNLSFSISSLNKELFKYQTDKVLKNLLGFKIPDSIDYNTGEKYFLSASESCTQDISAVVTVPEIPPIPALISFDRLITSLSKQPECNLLNTATSKIAVIHISFKKFEQKVYYALVVEALGITLTNLYIPYPSPVDFTVRESNTPGFFAVMHGFKTYHNMCLGNRMTVVQSPYSAYIIDGSKIPENNCDITLTVQFGDNYCVYDMLKSIHIKLMSIPPELYLFEKSLYTYKQVSSDPFSEPVYLNGNIKGGNGVFAICRSSELVMNFSPWY